MAETPLTPRLQRRVVRNGVGRHWCPLCHWSGHLKGQLGRYSTLGKASDTRRRSSPPCMWKMLIILSLFLKLIHTSPLFSWVASSNEATPTLDSPDFPIQKDQSPFSLMDTFRLRPNTLFISQFAHFCHLQKWWRAFRVGGEGFRCSWSKLSVYSVLSPCVLLCVKSCCGASPWYRISSTHLEPCSGSADVAFEIEMSFPLQRGS